MIRLLTRCCKELRQRRRGSHFFNICRTLRSGRTRIRTGDTMIFRSVPKRAVHRHLASWAESKRFSEVTDRIEPSANAMDRHAVVVQLWWAPRGIVCVSREVDLCPRPARCALMICSAQSLPHLRSQIKMGSLTQVLLHLRVSAAVDSIIHRVLGLGNAAGAMDEALG